MLVTLLAAAAILASLVAGWRKDQGPTVADSVATPGHRDARDEVLPPASAAPLERTAVGEPAVADAVDVRATGAPPKRAGAVTDRSARKAML